MTMVLEINLNARLALSQIYAFSQIDLRQWSERFSQATPMLLFSSVTKFNCDHKFPVKRKKKKRSKKRSQSMSISPTPKNRSRSRSSSRHSPSDSSRSLSPLSLRSASPNTRSPGWSSKQSKKSKILSESKKIFIIMTVPQIKFHPHEAHHTHHLPNQRL